MPPSKSRLARRIARRFNDELQSEIVEAVGGIRFDPAQPTFVWIVLGSIGGVLAHNLFVVGSSSLMGGVGCGVGALVGSLVWDRKFRSDSKFPAGYYIAIGVTESEIVAFNRHPLIGRLEGIAQRRPLDSIGKALTEKKFGPRLVILTFSTGAIWRLRCYGWDRIAPLLPVRDSGGPYIGTKPPNG